MSPTMVVTVLLPLEPVIAIMGSLIEQVNKSMSLNVFEPWAIALAIAFSSIDMPGLTMR